MGNGGNSSKSPAEPGLKISLSWPSTSSKTIGATSRHLLGLPFKPVKPSTSIVPSSLAETEACWSRKGSLKNEVSLRRLNMYCPAVFLTSSLALAIAGWSSGVYGKYRSRKLSHNAVRGDPPLPALLYETKNPRFESGIKCRSL